MNIGLILVACIAVGLVIAFLRDRAVPPKVSPMPTQLRFSVVDIGNLRYFDVRRFPREALIHELHVAAAKRSIARGGAAPTAYVWVMPPVFAPMLLDSEVARVLLLAPLRDPVPQPTPVFVYVDGWRPDTSSHVIAREAGVELLLELPREIGPDGEHDVRAMLDQAQPR